VGFDSNDDAGVYEQSPDLAIVQTADFITPVLDDPFIYGQIAAANSLSDVYAMGAKPITALNLVMYDSCHFPKEVLQGILEGGQSKIDEAQALLLGGHTIEDEQMKYGLSVTGTVHPKKVIKNNSAKAGDVIILTKPLGSGVLSTAIKADLASKETIKSVAKVMKTLNAQASQTACAYNPTAMTDVTGFGLLGHLKEMCSKDISIEIDTKEVPVLKDVMDFINMGIIPAGTHRNKDCLTPFIKQNGVDENLLLALCDAQTSGGLLIAMDAKKSDQFLKEFNQNSEMQAVKIAAVVPKGENDLYLL
jgi:selenide,water dikinase